MSSKATYPASGPASGAYKAALELETDAATVKRMLVLIAGTVGILALLGSGSVLLASGSAKSMLGYSTFVSNGQSEADRLAGKVVMGCKLGAVALVASRDQGKAAAGRDLVGQCDEVGAAIKSLPVTR